MMPVKYYIYVRKSLSFNDCISYSWLIISGEQWEYHCQSEMETRAYSVCELQLIN